MMPPRVRPTSPHLQIYRWQIGNTLSILHRLTGIALALGLIALCYWFVALASGPQVYAAAVGWTFAFSYHLLNGVRHLFWDIGMGFERAQRHVSGWLAVLGAAAMTVCVWALILAGHRS
jgi:succinate dehydrogenase / fumarate reductase, cytochrome b subunit